MDNTVVSTYIKFIEALLELANPILVAKIIDYGVTLGDYTAIIKYGIILIVTNVVGFGFAIAGQKCASLTSTKISASMREDVFKKIATYSHAELDKFGTASLVNRLTNDINQIETADSEEKELDLNEYDSVENLINATKEGKPIPGVCISK